MVTGGWTLFQAGADDAEKQAAQLHYQSDSRERWINEVAKKSWCVQPLLSRVAFSHQTRWDSLSPITLVTVMQQWQRSKMLDFAKKQHVGAPELKERFYINDREETSWENNVAKLGKCNDNHNRPKDIKIQPHISLWDRIESSDDRSQRLQHPIQTNLA